MRVLSQRFCRQHLYQPLVLGDSATSPCRTSGLVLLSAAAPLLEEVQGASSIKTWPGCENWRAEIPVHAITSRSAAGARHGFASCIRRGMAAISFTWPSTSSLWPATAGFPRALANSVLRPLSHKWQGWLEWKRGWLRRSVAMRDAAATANATRHPRPDAFGWMAGSVAEPR